MGTRTDLALEAVELHRAASEEMPKDVLCETFTEQEIRFTRVRITGKAGEKALGKPKGCYLTLEPPRALIRSSPSVCAGALRKALLELLPASGAVLVIGLGNRDVTPDAVGPRAADHVLATRHLQAAMPALFGGFRTVAAIAPGVLGDTGIETAELAAAAVTAVKPACVVAIDALAAAGPARLCASIQLADSGIVPGSGVRNDRNALNRSTLGVPVIAVGVPTVCDLREGRDGEQLIVTPGDIDAKVNDLTKIVAMGLNQALHPEIPPDELSDFVG